MMGCCYRLVLVVSLCPDAAKSGFCVIRQFCALGNAGFVAVIMGVVLAVLWVPIGTGTAQGAGFSYGGGRDLSAAAGVGVVNGGLGDGSECEGHGRRGGWGWEQGSGDGGNREEGNGSAKHPGRAYDLSAERQSMHYWRPVVAVRSGAGIARYRAAACRCFDRNYWNAAVGISLTWDWFFGFGLEGDIRYGGLWFPASGYVATNGYGVGIRSGFAPKSGAWAGGRAWSESGNGSGNRGGDDVTRGSRWWEGIYGRVGYQRLHVELTRQGSFNGIYGGIGFAHSVGFLKNHLAMEHEIPFTAVWGGLEHFTIGIRGSVVARW